MRIGSPLKHPPADIPVCFKVIESESFQLKHGNHLIGITGLFVLISEQGEIAINANRKKVLYRF
jgi:hypothetical protein